MPGPSLPLRFDRATREKPKPVACAGAKRPAPRQIQPALYYVYLHRHAGHNLLLCTRSQVPEPWSTRLSLSARAAAGGGGGGGGGAAAAGAASRYPQVLGRMGMAGLQAAEEGEKEKQKKEKKKKRRKEEKKKEEKKKGRKKKGRKEERKRGRGREKRKEKRKEKERGEEKDTSPAANHEAPAMLRSRIS